MLAGGHGLVYIPAQARIHLGWMGQDCHKADHNNRRVGYLGRHEVDQDRSKMDEDRREMDPEMGKAALREVQAKLAPSTQHLLVSSPSPTTPSMS